jgi:hypothetical protein
VQLLDATLAAVATIAAVATSAVLGAVGAIAALVLVAVAAAVTFTTIAALSTITQTGNELPKNTDGTRSMEKLENHEVTAIVSYCCTLNYGSLHQTHTFHSNSTKRHRRGHCKKVFRRSG